MIETVGQFKHSIVQPNPGWGDICEWCTYRFENPKDSDFPCKLFLAKEEDVRPNLERLSLNGDDVFVSSVRGVDFVEFCGRFELLTPPTKG